MQESKGQRIGKAPSLHLFHTTAIVWCMKATWQLFDIYLQGAHTYTTDAMHMLLGHTLLGHVLLCHYIICLYWQYNLDPGHAWTADWSVCETQLPMQSINNCIDGSRFSSQGCCLTVAWKRSKDGTLPIRWPLLSCIIPTLFAYFLACHPYIFLHF